MVGTCTAHTNIEHTPERKATSSKSGSVISMRSRRQTLLPLRPPPPTTDTLTGPVRWLPANIRSVFGKIISSPHVVYKILSNYSLLSNHRLEEIIDDYFSFCFYHLLRIGERWTVFQLVCCCFFLLLLLSIFCFNLICSLVDFASVQFCRFHSTQFPLFNDTFSGRTTQSKYLFFYFFFLFRLHSLPRHSPWKFSCFFFCWL